MGHAVPHVIGRHVHAKARPDDTTPPEPVPTGIDYLHLVEQQHTAELADRVRYAHLRDEPVLHPPVPDGHVAGQLPLPGIDSDADDRDVADVEDAKDAKDAEDDTNEVSA
jgi:putative transposase